jgi:reverse gyrase
MRIEICTNCGGKCKPQKPDDEAMCRICRLKKKKVKRSPAKIVVSDVPLAVGIKKEMKELSKTATGKEYSALMNTVNSYKEKENLRKDLYPKLKRSAITLIKDWFKFYDEERPQTEELKIAFKVLNEDEIDTIRQIYLNN